MGSAPGAARWCASLWDFLVILGWLVFLTVLGLVVRPSVPPVPVERTAPLLAGSPDAVAFLLTVLPVWVYLTTTESGRRRASRPMSP